MNRRQGPNTYRTPLRGARERFVSARDREGERAPPATPAVNSCFTTSAGRSAPLARESLKERRQITPRTNGHGHSPPPRNLWIPPPAAPSPLRGKVYKSDNASPSLAREDATRAARINQAAKTRMWTPPAPSLPLETWVREEEAPTDDPRPHKAGLFRLSSSLPALAEERRKSGIRYPFRTPPASLPPPLSLTHSLSLSLSAGEVRTAHQ